MENNEESFDDNFQELSSALEEEKELRDRRKKQWRIVSAVVVVLALAVGALFYFGVLPPKDNTPKQEVSASPSATAKESVDPSSIPTVPPVVAKNPVKESIEGYNPASIVPGEVTAYAEGNTVFTSSGSSAAFSGASLTSTDGKGCAVKNVEDFCYVGTVSSPSKGNYELFFLKDAAGSRMMEDPSSYTAVNNPGFAASGVVVPNVSPVPAGVVVFSDLTGFVLQPSGETSPEKVQEMVKSVVVK